MERCRGKCGRTKAGSVAMVLCNGTLLKYFVLFWVEVESWDRPWSVLCVWWRHFPAKKTFKSKKNYDLLEYKVLPSRTSWKVWAQTPGIKHSKIVPRIHLKASYMPIVERRYLFQASGIWKGTYFTWWWSGWKGREICHFWLVKKAQSSG